MGTNRGVIACTDVSFRYSGGALATNSVNLSLREGELYCLLGPNGAGKTTLIELIAGVLSPESGTIEYFERQTTIEKSSGEVRLGIIPQNVGLFDTLTAIEHLRYFGPLKGLSAKSTSLAIDRVVEQCDLSTILPKQASTLSGGQKRLLLFALALLDDPNVLVLDEPTVGLDPTARRTVWKTIKEQRNLGKTVFLTTHYLDEAEQLSNRIGFIYSGKIVRQGSLKELHGQLGKSVRLEESDPSSGDTKKTYLFDTIHEAQTFATNKNMQSYSIRKVSLEDVYLRILEEVEGKPTSGDN